MKHGADLAALLMLLWGCAVRAYGGVKLHSGRVLGVVMGAEGLVTWGMRRCAYRF